MELTNNSGEIEQKINILADGLKATQDMLIKYAASVTDLLSGTSSSRPSESAGIKPKRQAVTPGKKLGRPLGSKNKPKTGAPSSSPMARASAQEVVIPKAARVPVIDPPKPMLAVPEAPPAEKPLHPVSVELFHRVKKEGKVRLADLADGAKINRSLIHYHIRPLVEKGKVVLVRHVIKGHDNDVAYTPKEAAKYFASM
jgi:hypothetical protein